MSTAILKKVETVSAEVLKTNGIQSLTILEAELEYREGLLTKYGGSIFGIGQAMPAEQVRVHKQRIAALKRTIKTIARIEAVLRAEYEPYTPPNKWYTGYLERRNTDSEYRLFSGIMPPSVLEKYNRARASKLFDTFIVASPSEEHFQKVTRPPAPVDPVLVGLVRTEEANDSYLDYYGSKITGAIGFLVAQWDLEQDFKKAGII